MNHAMLYYREKLVKLLPDSTVDEILNDFRPERVRSTDERELLMELLRLDGSARLRVLNEVRLMCGLNR